MNIIIKDNGKGIPFEILDKLGRFELSYGKENGKGIGIKSSQDLIYSWGGEFDVESVEQKGTIIKIKMRLLI